jgi:CHAT domain-containing protein
MSAGRSGPLSGARLETEAISRLVPGSTTLLGSAASAQELDRLNAQGKLKTFRLLHFATPTQIDLDSPSRSALLLAQGKKAQGRLTVSTILRDWQLDADLVVLSGDQTGLGRDAGGDGLLGFGQALLSRGARSVVLSRWKVDDTATALLMVRFYENLLGKRKELKKGMPRAEALAEAKKWLRELPVAQAKKQLGVLAGGPRATEKVKLPEGARPFAHPYYWAAFVLVGDLS